MNRQPHQQQILIIGFAIFLLQACATATPIPTATEAVAASETKIPLSQQVVLTFISFREQGQSPVYTITAQMPKLAGTNDPRAQAFNEAAEKIVHKEIEYFRKNVLAQMPAQAASIGSSFDAQSTVVYQQGNLWSLKFIFSGYADGAAHPYQYSITFNFDLEGGEKLSLNGLFPPDTDFLPVISSYCIAELSKRDIGFYGGFQQGAEPTTDNYRNWNITTSGLSITFDEYQVAPYAAGPQTVLIPYSELAPLINSKSPLALFTR